MAVKLCDDDAADVDAAAEGKRLLIASLTDGAVHDEDDVLRVDRGGDLHHLVEQLLLLPVTARGVHDDDLLVFLFEVRHALHRDLHRVGLRVGAVERHAHLRRVLLLRLVL